MDRAPIIIGLCVNMSGVAMAFKWGFPQPDHEETLGLALEFNDDEPQGDGRTHAQWKADQKKQRAQYKLMAQIGLGLMGLGFALQVCGTLLSN